MEEIIQDQGVEQTSDAFLDGWDGDAEEPRADADQQTAEGVETAPEETESTADGEEQADEGTDTPQQETEQEEPSKAEPVPAPHVLKYMGEPRAVSDAEMVQLAQKGMDYDRIRTGYDEAKPVMQLFNQFAKDAGMSVEEYTAYIREQAHQAAGMSEAEARRTVELEDREARVAQFEQEEAERQQAVNARSAEEQRRANDIELFRETFPDAAESPADIPPEVWDGVRDGKGLALSYSMYQLNRQNARIADLEAQVAASKQNSKNEIRSTGSMSTAGSAKRKTDPFLEGWGD